MWIGPLLSVVVVAGAALAAFSDVRPATALAAVIAASAVAVAANGRPARTACALAALGALVVAHAAAARDRVLHPQTPAVVDAAVGDVVVVARGILLDDAQPAARGGARLLIDVHQVHVRQRTYSARFRAQVYVGGSIPPGALTAWRRGRTLQAPMRLSAPALLRNPGSRSERWQRLLRPYHLTGSIKSPLLMEVSPAPWYEEAGAAVRARVREALATLLGPARAEAVGVIVAILIGDRTGLERRTERRLQAAGTYHVIAISGGNVALLTGLALWIARAVARSYRTAALMTMAAVMAYGWIVGGDPSVGRAVTAACLYLAAVAAGVAPAATHVLAAAAILVVAADPLTVVKPGAWLSYGATLGIVLFATRLRRRVDPSRAGRPAWWRRAAGVALGLFGATLAAEIVLLPISAAVFTRVGVAGLLLNFVAIPAMALVQCAGLAAVCLFGWWDAGAAVAAWLASIGVWALIESTALLDVAPWLSWRTPPPSGAWLVCFYGAVAALFGYRHGRRARTVAAVCAGLTLLGVLTAPERAWARPDPGWLRLTMIDVGQGDALLVQFPTRHTLLVDAGAASETFDVGDRVVTPALWALGVRSLDWLAVTHADLDHIGGAASVVETFGVRELWEGVPVPSDAGRAALRAAVTAGGGAWRQLRQGDRLTLGTVDLDVLHPPEPDWERPRVRNDDSVVLRLRYGDVELLLTGDIGTAIESGLAVGDPPPRPPLRVLKVAHHGSRSSSGDRFVAAYDPVVALVSAGQGNLFGHPAPEVLARLAGVHARAWRTDRDGAVSVETDGSDLRVRTWAREARRGGRAGAAAWVARLWFPPP
jgi:competence protein ComEC